LSGDGGPAAKATLSGPNGIAFDSSGNLYIADTIDAAIRKISTNGIITTVAGGQGGYGGDNGLATMARLSGPMGVTVDASGNLYIADTSNQRIRYVNASGIITTIAGTGTASFTGDGSLATAATFSTPVAVAVDASGAVYVADLDNGRIRRFVMGGVMNTFAGTVTSVGDGGPSTQAHMVGVLGVAADPSGNLYIADHTGNRVRKVTPSGIITTLAGNGQTGYGGDNGPAASSILNAPSGVAVDSAGNVYIADAGNERIRRVNASTGIIATFAGNGTYAYTGTGTGGDGGLATAASLTYPTSWNLRRTPRDHRRQDQHLGRRWDRHARLQRRWRPAAPSRVRHLHHYRGRSRRELVYRGQGQQPDQEGGPGRSDHQHGSRQWSSQQLRRRRPGHIGGRERPLVGRGGRSGRSLRREPPPRAEGLAQRQH
jgi:sugar lactone lactonase YvrE